MRGKKSRSECAYEEKRRMCQGKKGQVNASLGKRGNGIMSGKKRVSKFVFGETRCG